MLFNLDFANDNNLSCSFFFFLIIDLCILIPAAITEFFNPIGELAILREIPTKEERSDMKTYPLTVETRK